MIKKKLLSVVDLERRFYELFAKAAQLGYILWDLKLDNFLYSFKDKELVFGDLTGNFVTDDFRVKSNRSAISYAEFFLIHNNEAYESIIDFVVDVMAMNFRINVICMERAAHGIQLDPLPNMFSRYHSGLLTPREQLASIQKKKLLLYTLFTSSRDLLPNSHGYITYEDRFQDAQVLLNDFLKPFY